jgi:DNA-binding SARP family transcriptional activator
VSSLHVRLFGRPSVQVNQQQIVMLNPSKAHELFVFLILQERYPQHREKLSHTLWTQDDALRANQYLRKAIWQLSRELLLDSDDQLLLVEREWIQLNPDIEVWLDAELLEQVPLKVDVGVETAEIFNQAITHYRGDLLEGWYCEWCLFERERLKQRYLATLDKLMRYCERSGQYELGIEYGYIVLRHDMLREHTHRQMMRLYLALGERTSAIRQFQKCAELLKQELNIPPARKTIDLVRAISADIPLPQPPQTKTNDSLADLLLQLRHHIYSCEALCQQVEEQFPATRRS